MVLPILAHIQARPEGRALQRTLEFADSLRHAHPALIADRAYVDLQASRLSEGASLLLDDMSGMALAERHPENVVLQERAVMRASSGDVVVTCTAPTPLFREYCRDTLRLGEVEWLHARALRDPMRLCVAAWTDRSVRRRLIHLLRGNRLHYLHPYMADRQAWTLARMLRSASRRPIKVIGPLPGICRLVNDKGWFARTVRGLFGRAHLPRTHLVYNVSGLAQVINHLADSSRTIVIKLPNSSGGAGNVRLPAADFRGCPPGGIRAELRRRLPLSTWVIPRRMVVSCWQSSVLCTPSAQLWIPPAGDGPPVIEGIFEQLMDDRTMKFRGSRSLDLPESVTEVLARRCYLLAALFQHLGYVGRCSFDLILTGSDLDECRLEFIECNGRWGGTSIPMTLMNRLSGDWVLRPYTTRRYRLADIGRIRLSDFLSGLKTSLYDGTTGDGRVILMNAAGIGGSGRLDLLVVGDTWSEVEATVAREIPRLIERIAGGNGLDVVNGD